MLKKGEQIIIINDPAQAPVKFYHKRGGSELAIGSQLEGLSYPGNGTYFPVTGADISTNPKFVPCILLLSKASLYNIYAKGCLIYFYSKPSTNLKRFIKKLRAKMKVEMK